MKYFRKEDIFTFLIERKTLNKQFLIFDRIDESNGGEQTYEQI